MITCKSVKDALFEAWLSNGTFYRKGSEYYVLQPHEERSHLRELVEKEDYDLAKEVAKGLQNKVDLSKEEVLRSYRISFPAYLTFISRALRENITLGKVIKEYLIKDIALIVKNIQNRDIDLGKIEYINDVYTEWKEKLSEGRSYKKVWYSVSSTISFQDITEEIAQIAQGQFMNKVRSECSEVPLLLERYLENVKQENLENIKYNPDLFQIRLSLTEENNIKISHIFWNVLHLDADSEAEFIAIEIQLREEFGSEAVDKLDDINEGFLLMDGAIFEFEVFSGILEQQRHEVYLDGIKVIHNIDNIKNANDDTEYIKYEQFKNALLNKYDLQIEQLRVNLEEPLMNNEFDEIAQITEELSTIKKQRLLADFSLEIISKLFHKKTQVISIRIPEILVTMWEAKQPEKFDSVFQNEV